MGGDVEGGEGVDVAEAVKGGVVVADCRVERMLGIVVLIDVLIGNLIGVGEQG